MECTEKKPDILKSKSLKSLIKGSLVILGLFIVLYFGIDILVLLFSKKFEYKLDILIIILASPIVVFLIALFCFFLFVNKMSYWFTGDKNDDTIFNANNTKLIVNVCNMIAEVIKSKQIKDKGILQNLIKEMLGKYLNIDLKSIENNEESKKQNITD